MLRENEPEAARIEDRPVYLRDVIFIVVLLVAICALSILFLYQLLELRSTAQPDKPVELLPTAILANYFSIYLPAISSEPVSVSEQIWKVTKIESLGYELDGQHYDLATFPRIAGQVTEKGYCMNRGWDVPDIRTEYSLNSEGIFVPLHEPDAHPLQRFLKIQQ